MTAVDELAKKRSQELKKGSNVKLSERMMFFT